MPGRVHHNDGPGAGHHDDGQSRRSRDHFKTPDGIGLYALGVYGIAFLLIPGLVDGLIQAGFGRWAVVVAGLGLLVGWGVALVGLVLMRTWGWVASLTFHGLALIFSLVAGNYLLGLLFLPAGFYVLAKGSLYLDDTKITGARGDGGAND